jgi:hypothetical protein
VAKTGVTQIIELRKEKTKTMKTLNLKILLMNILLVLMGCAATVHAAEEPSVTAISNAPGWVTVYWKHSGRGATNYLVQRQEPPYTWVFETNDGHHTDMGLKASTTYNYRVCAVDEAGNMACSTWKPVTTMAPESSGGLSVPVIISQDVTPDRISLSWTSTTRYGSFNVRWFDKATPNAAGQVNVKGSVTYGSYEIRNLRPGRLYVVLIQGCNWGLLGSSCSGWRGTEVQMPLPQPPPPPPPTAPTLTASASSARQIVLSWGVNEAERITRTVIERDGRPISERTAAMNRFDDTVRPNTEYTYRVCLTNQTGTACSNTITAMAKPVMPSALANVTFTQQKFSGAPGGPLSREAMRIKTVVRGNWRNTETPGQFITLEREDRGPTGPIQIGQSWTEVKQISAKTDPTEIWTEVKTGAQFGVREGNTYRVCTVVPALGKAGKVCSAPITPAQ